MGVWGHSPQWGFFDLEPGKPPKQTTFDDYVNWNGNLNGVIVLYGLPVAWTGVFGELSPQS